MNTTEKTQSTQPAKPTKDNKLTPEQIEAFGNEMDAIRQRLIAELGEDDAAYIRGIVKMLEQKADSDEVKKEKQKLRGVELEARSTAMLADIVQPRAYWKYGQGRIDAKTDPRTDWIKHIAAQVSLIEAKNDVGNTGQEH